ncbi:hypothetical protein IEQ34_020456 [Dendrobium chrysotoxum]|uniref:NPR1/NIM1-like C-terminal domain-containing protein n=1 Tax=Dendrobium chrysotoxum TaxID=161865 RepID=A0AAV7G2E2_DENCH|nr:hypothetical protein IEQ34_020456 [Dendrobium chrysotoxum]
MEIAQAEATSEFAGLFASRSASNLREVDLNETRSTHNKRLHSRVEALMKKLFVESNCGDQLDCTIDFSLNSVSRARGARWRFAGGNTPPAQGQSPLKKIFLACIAPQHCKFNAKVLQAPSELENTTRQHCSSNVMTL